MDGKMSVGVLIKTNGVTKSSSNAATTNVYGRLRAKRMIHIVVKFNARAGAAATAHVEDLLLPLVGRPLLPLSR